MDFVLFTKNIVNLGNGKTQDFFFQSCNDNLVAKKTKIHANLESNCIKNCS